MTFYVYIIYSRRHDIYYKGVTTDIENRLHEHNADQSRYTSGKGPWLLVYLEQMPDKRSALIREKSLKKANRGYLKWLLTQTSNLVKDR